MNPLTKKRYNTFKKELNIKEGMPKYMVIPNDILTYVRDRKYNLRTFIIKALRAYIKRQSYYHRVGELPTTNEKSNVRGKLNGVGE